MQSRKVQFVQSQGQRILRQQTTIFIRKCEILVCSSRSATSISLSFSYARTYRSCSSIAYADNLERLFLFVLLVVASIIGYSGPGPLKRLHGVLLQPPRYEIHRVHHPHGRPDANIVREFSPTTGIELQLGAQCHRHGRDSRKGGRIVTNGIGSL